MSATKADKQKTDDSIQLFILQMLWSSCSFSKQQSQDCICQSTVSKQYILGGKSKQGNSYGPCYCIQLQFAYGKGYKEISKINDISVFFTCKQHFFCLYKNQQISIPGVYWLDYIAFLLSSIIPSYSCFSGVPVPFCAYSWLCWEQWATEDEQHHLIFSITLFTHECPP